jgi:hypothetical protein
MARRRSGIRSRFRSWWRTIRAFDDWLAMAHPWHIRRRPAASTGRITPLLICGNDNPVLPWTPGPDFGTLRSAGRQQRRAGERKGDRPSMRAGRTRGEGPE